MSAGAPRRGHEIAFKHQGRIERNTCFLQRVTITLKAVMRYFILERTLDMRNAAMPQANKMAGSLIGPQAVISADPGRSCGRYSLVVDQDNRKVARVQFCQVLRRATRKDS